MGRESRAAFVVAVLLAGVAAGVEAQGDAVASNPALEAQARQRADSIRQRILSYATFAGFADAPCAPGDVRTFERDTASVVPPLLRRLETLVLSYNAFGSLDSDAGRALLRALTRLETGGPGPRWDVMTGDPPRAFNPILPTSLHNPVDNKCEDTPGHAPFGVVLPAVTGFTPPLDSGATPFLVEHGPDGVKRLRDAFFAIRGNDTSAVLRHTRVTAYGMWGDYAVMAVQRDAELRGIIPVAMESGGSAYLFHRAAGEWRLLAVLRTW